MYTVLIYYYRDVHCLVYYRSLHRYLLAGLDKLDKAGKGNPWICRRRLLCLVDEPHRSHTLVFVQDTPAIAMRTCEYVKAFNINIDSRKTFVRVGLGLNHNPEDIDRFLEALSWYTNNEKELASILEKGPKDKRPTLL